MIANDSQHLIQLAETGVRNDSNVACERTFDRIERMKAEEAMQPQPTTIHPWVAEQRAEAAKQEAARQAKIAAGKLVVHQNGNGYTEVLPPRR